MVIDEAGKPVAGAEVWLAPAQGPSGTPASAKTTTNAAGRFAFANRAPAGRAVTCAALAPGHALGWQSAAGARPYARIVLPPAVPLTGTVVDEHGKPVPGARIVTDATLNAAAIGQPTAWGVPKDLLAAFAASADARGHFAVPWAAAGTFIEGEASAPGRGTLDVELSRRSARVVLPPAVTVEGIVTCPANPAAVAGMKASAWCSVPSSKPGDLESDLSATVATDAQGHLRITGLPPGDLKITWHTSGADEWQPAKTEGLASKVPGTKRLRTSLAKAQVLRGRVVDKLTGKPVVGAPVTLDAGDVEEKTTTDATGTYSFHVLPVWKTGVLLCYPNTPAYAFRGAGPFPIRAVAEGAMEGRTLELQPRASIEGRVVDDRGRPVAGALVSVGNPVQDATIYDLAGPLFYAMAAGQGSRWQTTSDADGNFTLTGPPRNSGMWVYAITNKLMPVTPVPVYTGAKPAKARLEVSAADRCRLRGRVVDAKGKPLAGAWVRAHGTVGEGAYAAEMATAGQFTDAQGRFETPPLPSLCDYELAVCGPHNKRFRTAGPWSGVAGQEHDFGDIVLKK